MGPKLWQTCQKIAEKSSKIGPLGAPLLKTACFQKRRLIHLVLFRTRMERSGRQKEFIIRGSHVLKRLVLLSFISFRLSLTSFFTNVVGTGLPFGKLTMAFVVA